MGEEAFAEYRAKAKLVAEWMNDQDLSECEVKELALTLNEDVDELRFALVQSKRFEVDEEGMAKKTLLQQILDIMEHDIETVQEVLDKFEDKVDLADLKECVETSENQLRIKVANDIELLERVDLEAEQKLEREQEKEMRFREKEEKRLMKMKRGRKQSAQEKDSSSDSSSEDEGNVNKEAERKALAFRRLQVQRKIEDFLKAYTKGQNLVKVTAKGKRYHRRVYVDTARKALVVQGASGPKFFPFASMKEVDMETHTSKEGRVETMVICAIAKRGRIVKELMLIFPDQAKANTFVNCVTLFSVALRNKDS